MERDSEDVKEFLAEAGAYLDRSEPLLASLREGGLPEGDAIASIFRAFHSIKGVAGFLSFASVQEVTHKAEEALDRVRAGKRAFDADLGGALLEACDYLRVCLASIAAAGSDETEPEEKARLVARLAAFSDSPAGPRPSAAPAAGAGAGGWLYPWLAEDGLRERFRAGSASLVDEIEALLIGILDAPTRLSPLGEAADRIDRIALHAAAFGLEPATRLCAALARALRRPHPPGAAFDPQEMSVLFGACNALKPLLADDPAAPADRERAAVAEKELENAAAVPAAARPAQTAEAPSAPAGAPAKGGPADAAKAEIRVSLDKLDRMVEITEELGVVSAGVAYAAEDLGPEHEMRQSAAKMRQLTEELQEINVSIRMVPLSTVFRKMIRLVGDVSSKLGKKARLEIVGDETELDRDAAEALQDPLVHMIRNCIDHGLEGPAERKAAGKPEAGLVRLQAWHAGGEAWITISDDGRGIDRARLVAKAVEKGLVPAGYPPDDPGALDLIFHPGFSLAKEVTEFSGRGVGMDVVKRNIEGLKGRVEVSSKPGEGTAFTIRLPMANALTESMLVRVGRARYVLRVASIRETFRPAAKAITRLPDGAELVHLRGNHYPVVRLHRAHRIDGALTEMEQGLIVMVENRGRQVGLFVDEVLGKIQAVIKPAPALLKASASLAGCSIIGTASDAVALALDINALESAAPAPPPEKESSWRPY